MFNQAPSTDVQDKLSFMFNNIGPSTVEKKATEFLELIKEDCYPWFAQYMVMRRLQFIPFLYVFMLGHFTFLLLVQFTNELIYAELVLSRIIKKCI